MNTQLTKLKTELREFACINKIGAHSVWETAMAECLLGVIEWLDLYAIPTDEADKQLQQILTIWEAAK